MGVAEDNVKTDGEGRRGPAQRAQRASEKPRKRAGPKAAGATHSKTSRGLNQAEKQAGTPKAQLRSGATKKSGPPRKERSPLSRKELLERALDIVAQDLEKEERPANAVASLVQLLKLERLFTEDEEQPHEIRVVWQETDDETNGSAAHSREN